MTSTFDSAPMDAELAAANRQRETAQQVRQRLGNLHSPVINQWLQRTRPGAYSPPNPFTDTTLQARAGRRELVKRDQALGLALARSAGGEQAFSLEVADHLAQQERETHVAQQHRQNHAAVVQQLEELENSASTLEAMVAEPSATELPSEAP
ncbi:hypothetical protein CPCC7001_2453 [Cyanobium sp. PCC 7001]|uniref:hypothetical protein n=1 Tax=Cyanobium sp. PCC 7001 TaxID=180281 RepID=UPI0001805320|nr:hypothetical protein [Cyanobium sp. PCC 7001]EDY39572.1 hypothetical protein CPCC7001_2453 [Cyanobium sp. PCC 7001]